MYDLEEFADILMTEHFHSSNFQPGEKEMWSYFAIMKTFTLSLANPPLAASCP